MNFFFDELRRGGVLIATLAAMAGCADQPTAPVAASAPRPPAFKIQGFLPETSPPPADSGATASELRLNDPSAPADTPLCGTAAREANAAAAVISTAIEATGGACLSTACFDPLTDTFIGADGYRHVCQ